MPVVNAVRTGHVTVVQAWLLGIANVTVTPGTGLLLASRTTACSAVVNGVLIAAPCGVPALGVMDTRSEERRVGEEGGSRGTPGHYALTTELPVVMLAVNTTAVATP